MRGFLFFPLFVNSRVGSPLSPPQYRTPIYLCMYPDGAGEEEEEALSHIKEEECPLFPAFSDTKWCTQKWRFLCTVFVCISKAGWLERLDSDGHNKNGIFLFSISRQNLFFPTANMGQKRPKVTATQKMCSKRAHTGPHSVDSPKSPCMGRTERKTGFRRTEEEEEGRALEEGEGAD